MNQETNNDNYQVTNYVRIKKVVRDRFIEFDFSINDPELFVELILPCDAFKTFCQVNNVIELSENQGALIDVQMKKWRYGEDTLAANNKTHT